MENGRIMKSFDEFKSEFRDKLLNELEKRIKMPLDCKRHDISKVNEKYESLSIGPEGSNVSVNARLDKAFESYRNGNTMDAVVQRVADAVERALYNIPDVKKGLPDLEKYEDVKSRLVMEIISIEENKPMLENIPHKDLEDMAIIYRIDAKEIAGDGASIVVNNSLMEKYGLTLEQLHEDAMQSAPVVRPMVIEGMATVLAKSLGAEDIGMLGLDIPPEQEQMFVATVKGNTHGASVLAYEDFMDKAAEKLGGDFFILPSSLHEVILIPDNGQFEVDTLKAMVKDINESQVAPEDRLTNSVYHYDSKEKIFEIGEKFEARQRKMAHPEKKKSVLAELKAAKEEIASRPKKEVVDKGAKAVESMAL